MIMSDAPSRRATPAVRLLEKLETQGDVFPTPQLRTLELVERKLRYLGITVPEDNLCDDAQGGLGLILADIADEIASVAWDLGKEEKERIDKLRAECETEAEGEGSING
jgi:hypothetical protein